MNEKGIEAEKVEIGETIEFADYMINTAQTRFGEVPVVMFANAKGEITRKVFSESLAKWLKSNKPQNKVTLKKKLIDGDLTYNVWE